MEQLQFFRDYELTFKDSSGNEILTLTNTNDNGIGLRINFNISLASVGDSSQAASSSIVHPARFQIYNLSTEHHKIINNGTLSLIDFSAGYRDSITGGNSNKAALIIDGQIMNSVTYRKGADLVTDIYSLTSKQKADTKLDKMDLYLYQKSLIYKRYYSQREIFLYYLKKYFPSAIINPQNIQDLDTAQNTGFTFSTGTTALEALQQIANKLPIYIDSTNVVHAISPENYNKISNIYPQIEVNQNTGLLNVPILSASGVVSATTLLNPAITPFSVVNISTQDGFAQSGVLVKTNLLPVSSQLSRVIQVTYIGDSRGGAWQTRFTTYPVANGEAQ